MTIASYMEVVPLICPKCKKSIEKIIQRKIDKKCYYECPKCKYKSKNGKRFVDKETIEKQRKHFQKMLEKCRK